MLSARSSPRSVGHSPIRAPLSEAKEGETAMLASKQSSRRGSAVRTEGGVGEGLVADKIAYLQEATETLTKRIEMEKRKSEELEKKIKISRGKLDESRARMKGSDETTAIKQRAKAVRSAEHRLDVMMARLNTINKQNETRRGDIESLRRDKLQRQRILKRLEREVVEAQRRLENVANEAATATDARDKAEREIQAIQSTIQREAAQFEAEFTQKITGFTEAAVERRKATEAETNKELAVMEGEASASQGALVRPGVGPAEETHGSMTVEQEIELKHKSIKTLWEIARREVEVKQQSAKLAELEEAFGKIQEFTGISTIDEMVNAFVATEDRNYAVLTMINDLNREIEAAEVENASLRNAVEEARAKGSVGFASRDRLSKDWDSQLNVLAKKTAAYDKMYEAALRSLDAIKPGVHSIFQKVGSSDTAAAETLAAAGVTDGNIMTHLGLIEQRASELIHMYEMSVQGIPLTLPTEEEEAQSSSSSPAGQMRQLDVEISRVGGVGSTDNRQRRAVVSAPVPPSLADLDESDDDDEVFLTMPSIGLGTGNIDASSPPRRASVARGRANPVPEADAELMEPMSLDELREHTIALVERKQAKAEKRERLVEQARVAFLDSLPPSTAAAMYASSKPTRTSVVEPQLTGTATLLARESTQPRDSPQTAARTLSSAGGVSGRDVTSRGSPAGPSSPILSSDASQLVPRPPSQRQVRPAGPRPGVRGRV